MIIAPACTTLRLTGRNTNIRESRYRRFFPALFSQFFQWAYHRVTQKNRIFRPLFYHGSIINPFGFTFSSSKQRKYRHLQFYPSLGWQSYFSHEDTLGSSIEFPSYYLNFLLAGLMEGTIISCTKK